MKEDKRQNEEMYTLKNLLGTIISNLQQLLKSGHFIVTEW